VARRAAELFRMAGARSVLDVGSGVGKFALVAAATSAEATFVGVEQRGDLVEVARRAQEELGTRNASFTVGDATDMLEGGFQGYYFYNPFGENLFDETERIDHAVELTESRFRRDAMRAERALRSAPRGTAVVTYNGMGGRIPSCYELGASEPFRADWLRLWVKRGDDDGGSFLEQGERVVVYPTGRRDD
jgi:predicted RNA methylase